ncbi:MAG TPA: hypothetical protein VM935_04795 [Chitinophagaceae bacterium]|jgi:YD repeat-containing protein|nr:hypothetical protein [Chitinophagaceae bacterium]
MKYSILLISFIVFLLPGCKKEKESEASPNGIVKIKELNYSVYQNYSSQFIYSADGRLMKRITKAYYDDDPNNHSYDTIEFEYSGNNVSSIRFSPTSFTNLSYDRDGNIIQSDVFRNGVLTTSDNYLYDKHILREIQNEKANSTITFTYDSRGNLSEKTYYSNGSKTRTVTFPEYDDKPNPFKGNQLVFESDRFNFDDIDYFSKNNPLKREADGSWAYGFTYTYIYNTDGFWTGGPQYTIKYN